MVKGFSDGMPQIFWSDEHNATTGTLTHIPTIESDISTATRLVKMMMIPNQIRTRKHSRVNNFLVSEKMPMPTGQQGNLCNTLLQKDTV